MQYVGRFAPSPTGPLHIGSLVTAVASYLAARQARGCWLVRIEDIDPPREAEGAATSILRALDRLELHWDGDVLFQSTRLDAYRQLADDLLATGHAYRCSCTRAKLRRGSGKDTDTLRYPGYCRSGHAPGSPTSIRLRAPVGLTEFIDQLQGQISTSIDATSGDYVIFRRDGLPAYHLAVVADDAFQHVTHVVRGVDLLDSTPQHIHLQQTLGVASPQYCHLPVIVNTYGQKLSKQTGAVGIAADRPTEVAGQALRFLGLEAPAQLRGARPRELWRWAIDHWNMVTLRGRQQIREDLRDVAE